MNMALKIILWGSKKKRKHYVYSLYRQTSIKPIKGGGASEILKHISAYYCIILSVFPILHILFRIIQNEGDQRSISNTIEIHLETGSPEYDENEGVLILVST